MKKVKYPVGSKMLFNIQKKFVKGEVNSYMPKEEPQRKILATGVQYQSEIKYGDKYPNSYLDIYSYHNDKDNSRPTLLFIHGGGYVWGDKAEGDANAKNVSFEETMMYYLELVKDGFNVVSINYALAPEYVYPVPIYQINEAIIFLIKHQDEYRMDMNRVIFVGGSAGGQLAGQYVNIQTNPEYAQELMIRPVLSNGEIKAVVFNCALLDPARFDKTDSLLTNYLFRVMKMIYFRNGIGSFKLNIKQGNVIKNMTRNFPPTYITDGNSMTFVPQAKEVANQLDKLNIKHQLTLYEKSEAKLLHGYDVCLGNPKARDNYEKMIMFLTESVS